MWNRQILATLLAAALGLAGSWPAIADLESAVADVQRGNYEAAFQELKRLSELGDPAAQVRLGGLYEQGLGIAQDYAEALRWYRASAEQGYPMAQGLMGDVYSYGLGVPVDWSEAVRWYRMAAEKEVPSAQVSLGYAYETGQGVAQDESQALHWYFEAANRNDPQGLYNVGTFYEHGRGGLTPDPIMARNAYEKAAAQGHEGAREALARLGGPLPPVP